MCRFRSRPCAGLEADRIAEFMGIDIDAHNYRQYFWKGEYFRLKNIKPNFINRLIYPIPRPNNIGLGIHATVDLGKGIKLGPNATYIKERYYDFTVNKSVQRSFYEAAKLFLRFIRYNDLSPDMAGIRPKLQQPGDKAKDFVIKEESEKDLPGVVNLIGIESPGLTASMAIAKYISKMLI